MTLLTSSARKKEKTLLIESGETYFYDLVLMLVLDDLHVILWIWFVLLPENLSSLLGCFYFHKQICTWLYINSDNLTFKWKSFFNLTSSENEEDRISQNGRPAKSEFKDEEETVTPKSAQVMQATETTNTTSTTTRKRGGIPSKTVDLGAAAHYTGEKSSPDADNTMVVYICLA